ncbi:MAG: hypothetical protein EHM35_00755 [Planctomycetaceae bacterium]|nr:MAG: hypothetical protein EHM35_00755 [Planctomycetaceae bacterium]
MLTPVLPKSFRCILARSRARIDLGAMVEPLVQIGADGRCWVYESYRNTLGLGGLTGLIPLHGPTDLAGVQQFLAGYRAGEAKSAREDPVVPAPPEYQI